MTDAIAVGFDDLASSEPALRWAIAEARRRGLPVHVAVVWQNAGLGTYRTSAEVAAQFEVHAVAQARKAEEVVKEAGIAVHTEVFTGRPASSLVEASRDDAMVVIGAGQDQHSLIGSIAHEVVRHAKCSCAIVRPTRHPAEVVVVAAGGSDSSAAALEYAADYAADHDVALLVVYPGSAGPPDVARLRTAHPGMSVTTQVQAEDPVASLVGRSEEAALVVVGAHSPAGTSLFRAHSVAQEVADRARCSVVVVR